MAEYDYITTQAHTLLHALDGLQISIHKDSQKWWTDSHGNPIARNKGEQIALMHSELSECLEGVRKDLQDDHLPQYKMEIVELADTIIRIFDYCEGHKLGSLGPVILNKLLYNRQREDHTHEARAKADGKKF